MVDQAGNVAANSELRRLTRQHLDQRCSPAQIANTLAAKFRRPKKLELADYPTTRLSAMVLRCWAV